MSSEVESREAAKECSPRRKPWVGWISMRSPEGAKETSAFVLETQKPRKNPRLTKLVS